MKAEVIYRPFTVSMAFSYKGRQYIVIDSRLPRPKRIAALAELKASLKRDQ